MLIVGVVTEMRSKLEDNACDSCDTVEIIQHHSLRLSKGKGNREVRKKMIQQKKRKSCCCLRIRHSFCRLCHFSAHYP